jgi:hypothetical protein
MNWMLARRPFALAGSETVALAAAGVAQARSAETADEFAPVVANSRLAKQAFVRSDRLVVNWQPSGE